MCGANVNSMVYNTTATASEKYNIVEKSLLSTFFFCIKAVLNPPSMITLQIFINMVTNATVPYCSGKSFLAISIVTAKLTSCVPNLSKNFQKRDFITKDLFISIA